MWIYRKCTDEMSPCQLINTSDLVVITTLDCASVTYGVSQHYVVGYSDYKDLHHSSDYLTLAVTESKEEAECLVQDIYEAIRAGAPVFEVPY